MLPQAPKCANCGCESPPTCSVKFDDFNRGTVGGPGTDWEELVDSWPIVSNQLNPPANGIIRLLTPVPTDADGYKWAGILHFANLNGTYQLLIDMMETSGPTWQDYHYLEITATGLIEATIQLFKMTSGTPVALKDAVRVQAFDRRDPNLVFVCINTDTTEIVGTLLSGDGGITMTMDDGLVLHTGGVGADRFVGFGTVGLNASAIIDDAELLRIGGASACGNCDALEDCEVCENTDSIRPNKALPNIKLIFSGLADGFFDEGTYQGNGIFSTGPIPGGTTPDGVDDFTWDFPQFDGIYILPFDGCTGSTGGTDGISCAGGTLYDGAVIYGNLTLVSLKEVIEGLLLVNGQIPLLSGDGYALNGSIWDASSHVSTTSIVIRAQAWLARRIAGGFKIYCRVRVGSLTTYQKVATGSGQPFAPPWSPVGGSSFSQISAAVFEADWDGDCIALPDTALSLVEVCDTAGHANWGGVSLTIGAP